MKEYNLNENAESNLPAKQSVWTKLKDFLFQEIKFPELHDFLFQDISFFGSKSE